MVSEWVTGTPFTALLRDGALDAESRRPARWPGWPTGSRRRTGPASRSAACTPTTWSSPAPARSSWPRSSATAGPRPPTTCAGSAPCSTARSPRTGRSPRPAAPPRCARPPPAAGTCSSPRQVRAGVPEDLSNLAVRALDQGSANGRALGRRDGQRARRPGGHGGSRRRVRPRPGRPAASSRPALGHARPAGRRRPDRARAARLAGRHRARRAARPRRRQQPDRERRHPDQRARRPRRSWSAIQPDRRRGCTTRTATAEEAKDIDRRHDGNPDTSWRTAHYRRNSDVRRPQARHRHRVRLRQADLAAADRGVHRRSPAPRWRSAPATTRTRPTRTTTRWSARPGRCRPTDTFPIKTGTSARYYIVWMTQLAPDGPEPVPGVDLRGRLQALTRPDRPLGSPA